MATRSPTGLLHSPEETFNRMVRLAANLARVPIAFVSLLDGERQVVKASVGIDKPWLSPDGVAFDYSLGDDDPRLAPSNALEAFGLAAYVRLPLVGADGHPIGNLCVLDTKPREWTAAELECLADVAATVVTTIELRVAAGQAEYQAQRLFEDAQDMISLIGADGRLLSANRSFARALDYSGDELLKMNISDLMPAASHAKALDIAKRLRDGELVGTYELELQTRGGNVLTVEVSTQLVYEDGVAVAAQAFARDVTASRAADRALRQSEERFALAVEGTSDGIWDFDIPAQQAYYSPRWKEMLGYAADELPNTTETWENLIHPDDRERVINANATYLADDSETFECEYRLRHKDGSYRWILSRGKALVDESGKKIRYAGAQTDVTEKRELVRELAESESFLRTIFDSAPQCIGVITADSEVVVLNRVGLDVLQVADRGEVVGTSLLSWVKERWRDDVAELHRQAADGMAGSLTYEIEGAQGKTTVLRTHAAPFNPDGSSAVIAISEDVTAQQASAATQEMQRDVISRMDIGIYVYELTDPSDASSLVLVEANAGAEQATGVPSADILGKRILEAFPNHKGTDLPETFRQVALGGAAVDLGDVDYGDTRIQYGTFTVRLFPLPNRRVGISFANVTAQREFEAELRRAHKMEAVGRLAGGIAHDFNNLLTAMSGYTAFALGRLQESDHALRRDLDEVQHGCERARGLTQQLLAFSRHQVLQPRALDLNEIVGDTLRLLEHMIGEGIEVQAELEPELAVTRADRGQLEQVLMNLVLNSRDAMTKGGVLRLTTMNVDVADGRLPGIGDVPPGSYVRLAVDDTGCGMNVETLEKVFEPFFTTKEVGQGTGLGLATVYGIIEQSGGYIGVDSEPGFGTTFAVYLPAVADEIRPLDETPELAPTGGDEHILLVEDEEVVREVVHQMLKAQGYAVTVCAGPEAALVAAESESFDLLLTDVVMPKMTGPELVDELLGDQPQLAVIYVSGYTANAAIAGRVEADEVGFLQKPFTIDELGRKVRSVLDAPTPARA